MTPDNNTNERRKENRVQVELKVCWEGALAQLEGKTVDLSTSGCFILTADLVRVGELIRVAIYLPKSSAIYVWGVVVYQIPEMGFAINFTGGDEADLKQLEFIIRAEYHRAKKSDQSNQEDAQYSFNGLT